MDCGLTWITSLKYIQILNARSIFGVTIWQSVSRCMCLDKKTICGIAVEDVFCCNCDDFVRYLVTYVSMDWFRESFWAGKPTMIFMGKYPRFPVKIFPTQPIHFRLGFSLINHPAIKGYPHASVPDLSMLPCWAMQAKEVEAGGWTSAGG